jgi:hypothetical protein
MAKQPTIETTVSYDPDGCADGLTLVFDNGETLHVKPDTLTQQILANALMHGLKQKLVDAAAISRNTETGRSATTEDKYNAVRDVYDRLLVGQWNKQREGGTGLIGAGLLFTALCRHYPKQTPEKVRAFMEGKSPDELVAMRKIPAIAAHITVIKLERAKPGTVDGDELLAGLDDMENGDE